MTNQEIDSVIFRIERRTLWRSLLATQFNTFAFIALAMLGTLAVLSEQLTMAVLLFLFSIFLLVLPVGRVIQRYNLGKRTEFWAHVRKRGLGDQEPSDNTKLLIDKIVAIQTATPGNELLTLRQAVKLVTVYEQQSQKLRAINVRLAKLNSTYQTISQKIKQLQALGESHAAGLLNLEQTRADFEALQKVAREIQSSCDRLEAILNGVRKTARARQLHRELDQLSAAATPTVQPHSVQLHFDTQSLEEIERQIGREIETYLRLERETEERLR